MDEIIGPDDVTPTDGSSEILDWKIEAVKLGVTIVVGSSIKHIVSEIIESNVPTPDTRIQKAKLVVGTYVVSAFVADKLVDYTETRVDSVVQWGKKLKDQALDLKKDVKFEPATQPVIWDEEPQVEETPQNEDPSQEQ